MGSLCLVSFMDVNWQHNNPANPAAAAIGPQGYDNHLYYRLVIPWLTLITKTDHYFQLRCK
jgi:hypothetical protein